jgi:manganese-dependent inorganic pyrophosphatase
MALHIVGHKIPDSDSICSAIAVAYLKNQLGIEAIACKLGDINSETKFILDKFGFDEPITKTS